MQQSAASPVRRILLAGNPNSGKSTLFNRLTGQRQRTGNYPGVTVEKRVGEMQLGKWSVEVLDLPGTYSLAATSPDEHVAVEALTGTIDGPPSLVVCVVDASSLQRHLFLVSQICDFEIPVVVALNMIDLAERRGVQINATLLAERLGCAVVPIRANTGQGIPELLAAIENALDSGHAPKAMQWPPAVANARDHVRGRAAESIGRLVTRAEGLRLLFDPTPVGAERMGWTGAARDEAVGEARAILQAAGINPSSSETVLRYAALRELLEGVISRTHPAGPNWTARIDAVLTHPVWGLAFFAALMCLVFISIYSWASPIMDLIEYAVAQIGQFVAPTLEATPMLHSLVVDGIIGGVGSVLVFLPQIMILFLFISVLEESGYMARAAFLMDRALSWCGLTGRSFVPMLSSFACAVPGILSARVIAEPRARLLTILISPLMSCSARLPVYTLMIGAFLEPRYGATVAGFLLFSIHLLGLAVALPCAWIINRFLLKMPAQSFVLEIPPYRIPTLSGAVRRALDAASSFIMRAGGVILAISLIIWALLYFPRPEELAQSIEAKFAETVASERQISPEAAREAIASDSQLESAIQNQIAAAYLEQSLLARAGRWIQPIFDPAGFDWKITVGVLASFPAREIIVSTLGIIYKLGADVDEENADLRTALASEIWQEGPRKGTPVFTPAVALAIMVFFALCMQCGATLAVMARETAWRWAVFAFCYMTLLAWLGAVLTYQIFSRLLPV